MSEKNCLIYEMQVVRIVPTKKFDFVDITPEIQGYVNAQSMWTGWITVFVKHTTAVIHIGENEPNLLSDHIVNLRGCLAPHSVSHNVIALRKKTNPDTSDHECPNADSHFYAAVFGTPNVLVPVKFGFLELGKYQKIFLVELDDPRARVRAGQNNYRKIVLGGFGREK